MAKMMRGQVGEGALAKLEVSGGGVWRGGLHSCGGAGPGSGGGGVTFMRGGAGPGGAVHTSPN